MIGYITLGTTDLKRGAEFYDAIAQEMDTPRMMGSVEDGYIAWGKPGGKAGIALMKPHDGHPMSVGNGSMVALDAKDEDHVKRIYDMALSLGGTCEGKPGPRGGGFYAAYFRDLDGHKLNAFCMPTAGSAGA